MTLRWESLECCSVYECGKRRNGKPKNVMVMHVVVCVTESDAKAMSRAHPRLKFVRKGRASK